MSKYRIEKRPVGWRKYRILLLGVRPLFGDKKVDRVVGEFLTRRGAERFIALRSWTPVTPTAPTPAQPRPTRPVVDRGGEGR